MLRDRKRILVIGCGGAGKSTFARALGAALGLPVIHLDRHYWQPGWRATPSDEWNVFVEQLVSGEAWIVDGNYGGSLDIRLRRCDAVVFLDVSRGVCLWSVVKRRWATGRRARVDMAPGCPERLSLEFLRWIWRYPYRSRPRVLAALAAVAPPVEIVTLSSRRDAGELLRSCGVSPPQH